MPTPLAVVPLHARPPAAGLHQIPQPAALLVKTHPAPAPVVNRITGDSIHVLPVIIVPLTWPPTKQLEAQTIGDITQVVPLRIGAVALVVKLGDAIGAYVFAKLPPKHALFATLKFASAWPLTQTELQTDSAASVWPFKHKLFFAVPPLRR